MLFRSPGGKKVNALYKGFTIMTDQSKEYGGGESAPEPFDMFLASIGTCAGINVIAFCQKRDIPTGKIKTRQISQVRLGKKLFASYCSTCHGEQGQGSRLKELDKIVPSILNQSFLSVADHNLLYQRIADSGKTRRGVVGRIKIEQRPLMLIEAKCGDNNYKVILQNAETIKLVGENGSVIPVTSLKEGDKILMSKMSGARHFGMKIEEKVVER